MESGHPAIITERASSALELEPLVEVTRGNAVESRHFGHVAVVEGSGKLIASFGDPERATFMRSCAKPFQAIPLITTGAADAYNFSPAEIAIACGSHHGLPEHVHTVTGMLTKIGLTRSALRCGPHRPFNADADHELIRHGSTPNQLHNNCSGKHAAFLATALKLGGSAEDYDWPSHPVQKEVVKALSAFASHDLASAPQGYDGCGAPIFALPLSKMALAYARLVAPGMVVPADYARAAERIVAAMKACPEMIACPGCFDTELTRLSQGKTIAKGGAEAVYCVAFPPQARWPSGLGIALKIEDGNDRARWPAVLRTFSELSLLPETTLAELRSLTPHVIRNHSGAIVGNIEAVFNLTMHT
ncbi:MAG TPA: asparaginase [Methylomirabilota bacterium]|nr:asparaginase [Methylomirabilota bacterium]